MIARVPKTASFIVIGLVITSFLAFFLKHTATAPARQDSVIVNLAGQDFTLRVADTPESRERGLSFVPKMATHEGMLFEFQQPDEACFWMKDMQFNLDILWFDTNKKLIYQQQNLAPNTFPQRFCPPSPAAYVLEINPSLVQLKMGSQITLQKQ